MAQTLAGGDLTVFGDLTLINSVSSALADVAITTGATTSSTINFGVAGLKQIKARLNVKGASASSVGQIVLAVSTTSAFTGKEVIAAGPVIAPATTNGSYVLDVVGRSITGFQYGRLEALQLSGTAAFTVDASVLAV